MKYTGVLPCVGEIIDLNATVFVCPGLIVRFGVTVFIADVKMPVALALVERYSEIVVGPLEMPLPLFVIFTMQLAVMVFDPWELLFLKEIVGASS